ncbi:MAG: hypothetical protein HY675_13240 [Chloroflexi bacterium]|nr:hypothetical protein [Chloroflexota bacterium]
MNAHDDANSVSVLASPSLVLGIGKLGSVVVADVERIFLAGDKRRAAVTYCLSLSGNGGELSLVPVRNAQPGEATSVVSRRDAYQIAIAKLDQWRDGLEDALHDLRSHERLIAAGLGDVRAPSMDVIVVAGLTDPLAAGILIPLACAVHELLAAEPEGMAHFLLSTASFPSDQEDEQTEAQMYAILKELNTFADPSCISRFQQLASALAMEKADALTCRIYLFDRRKDGMREVRDQAELQVIMGNAVLALLSGGLAQHAGRRVPELERLEKRAFYSGAGATALVFEPEPLIQACASRQGARFLNAEMGVSSVANAKLATDCAIKIEDQMGSLRNWLERLAANTPCQVEAEGDELHFGIHFTGFQFGRIPKEDWANAIANYDALFGRTKMPRHKQTVEDNAAGLSEIVLATVDASIDALPQRARLYPGGLKTAKRALKELDEKIRDREDVISAGSRSMPLDEDEDLNALALATCNYPDLPAFFGRLLIMCVVEAYVLSALGSGLQQWIPAGQFLGWILALLACAVTVGAYVFWLWRVGQRIIALREHCVTNAEHKYASLLEQAAREQLKALCTQVRSRITKGLEDLGKLDEKVTEAQGQLAGQWIAYAGGDMNLEDKPQDRDGSDGSPFRPSPIDDGIVNWVYNGWGQKPADMRRPVLEEHDLLHGWREVTTETLVKRLQDYGCKVFAPVWNVTLAEILDLRGHDDTQELLTGLARDAVPLLRANFDRLGGGAYAQPMHYVLVQDPRKPALSPVLRGPLADYTVVTTGDPYVAVCCRLRHMIPLAALRDLIVRGRKEYGAMEPDKRKALHLFDEWVDLPDEV